jgi:hypothetical protein
MSARTRQLVAAWTTTDAAAVAAAQVELEAAWAAADAAHGRHIAATGRANRAATAALAAS